MQRFVESGTKALFAFVLLVLAGPPAIGQLHGSDPLFLITQGGQSGYIDQTGKIIITPQFGGAWGFYEERTCVQTHGSGSSKYAVIDNTGKFITPAEFSACGQFSQGLGAVAFDTDKTRRNCMDCDPFYHWGYVDREGTIVIKPQFHNAHKFSEDLAAVQNDDGKWGFIDKTGKTVISMDFDYAGTFSEGLAVVVVHQRYGYVDHNGKLVISARFKQAQEFSEGLALVRTRGKFVAPFGITLGTAADERKEFEYIDKSGKVRLRLKGEHASDFSEGLAEFGLVKQDGHLYCGYADKSGKLVIEPRFGSCDDFSDGLGLVLLDGKWHFIDKNGEIILSPPYVEVWPFQNGLARVLDGPTPSSAADSGYIDRTGKVIWRPQH